MTASNRYSLGGVRRATTAPHEAFIAKAQTVLAGDERVLAAYLVGGFAVGMGDAFSDVDLHIVVTDEAADELAEAWPDLIHEIAPTVWISPSAPSIRTRPAGNLSAGSSSHRTDCISTS